MYIKQSTEPAVPTLAKRIHEPCAREQQCVHAAAGHADDKYARKMQFCRQCPQFCMQMLHPSCACVCVCVRARVCVCARACVRV